MTTIHPTAVIDSSSQIADGVEIGAWTYVGPGVEIGEGTVLREHVHIGANTTMGRGNVVAPFAAVGGEPQDRKFHGEHTVLRMGHENDIREHVTIHRGTGNGGGETVIGSNCLIMVGAHIAHDCILGDHVTLANQVMLAGHVIVEDGAAMGGGAALHHFVTVGTMAFIGGLSRVGRDAPPYMISEGHPADVRAINSIGLVRSGMSQDTIDILKTCYKRLFRGGPAMEGVVALREEFPEVAEVGRLCDAIEAANKGTHGRAMENARPDDRWAKADG